MEHHNNNPLASILLLFTGFFSKHLANISYEYWKSEVFYYLSVLSVLMIVIINAPKVFEIIKGIFKKKI